MKKQNFDVNGELSARQRALLKAREYYAQHREARVKKMRAYVAAHRDEIREKQMERQRANPRKYRLKQRRYHAEKPWMQSFYAARIFCRKNKLPFDMDHDFMVTKYAEALARGVVK